MLVRHCQKLLALAAVLTLPLTGCAIGKKDIAAASYTAKPVVPPIEQLGSSSYSQTPTTNPTTSAAAFMGASSSCRNGFS